jgi:hypothetical protein
VGDPARDFADTEIESCLTTYGDWCGWLGDFQDTARRALEWKASQGDELPDELLELRDAIAQFGHAPIEEAVARVQGLEKAVREIERFVDVGLRGDPADPAKHAAYQLASIREIVRMCVKFEGSFGVADDG